MPLLLLLSRLRPSLELEIELDLEAPCRAAAAAPSDEGATVSGGALVRELIQLVVHCRGQRHHAARAMAARALSALCPSMNAGALAAALAGSLPTAKGAGAGFVGPPPNASPATLLRVEEASTTNALHGTLIMVQELMPSAVAAAARAPSRDTLSLLLKALERAVPQMVGSSLVAPPIRLEALKVLGVLQVRGGVGRGAERSETVKERVRMIEKTIELYMSTVFIRHNTSSEVPGPRDGHNKCFN